MEGEITDPQLAEMTKALAKYFRVKSTDDVLLFIESPKRSWSAISSKKSR